MALSSQIVHQRLHDAARRFRWSRSARFLISGTAVSLFFLAVFLLCDAQFHFGAVGRWIGFVSTTSALVAGMAMAFLAWRPQISEAGIARRIETACAGARNVLISAVQFDQALPANSPLRTAIFSEMHDPFPQVRWEDVFDLKLLKRLALALAAVFAVLTLWGIISPTYFLNSAARIFLPAKNIAPLTRTKIVQIVPADPQIVHGAEAAIAAQLGGEIPRAAWVHFREAGSGWQKALLDHEVGQPVFSHRWKDVRQPIDFYIQAGDARSDTHRVSVRPKTAIRTRTATIQPPRYTNADATVVQGFNVLQNVLPGSKVTVALEFNNAIGDVKAADDKGGDFAVEKISDTRWKLSSTVAANRALKINFTDTAGASDQEALNIAVKADEPPKISIAEPAEGRELLATRDAMLHVKFTATDNFGLGSVALYRSTNDKQDAQLVQDWKDAADQKSFAGEIDVPIKAYAAVEDERVTFCLIAKDQNDVTGPGVTVSRPIVVSLKSADKVQKKVEEATASLQKGLDELIKLQKTNLDETRGGARMTPPAKEACTTLLNRQVKIADMGRDLAASADTIAPDVRNDLNALNNKEFKDAVLALRDSVALAGDAQKKSIERAIQLEVAILAKLQGAPAAANADVKQGQIQDLIAGVEDLLRKQREIMRETNGADDKAAKSISGKQDALADQSVRVRKDLDKNAHDASVGDADFRARLGKVAGMFGELKIYEDMLTAAEKLSGKNFAAAGTTQKQIVINLTKMLEILNQWQLAASEKKSDDLRKEAEALKAKLDKLEAIQREVVEKSKEMARKDQDTKDESLQKEINETKDLMKQVLEKMLTDAHAFPDMKPANELRSALAEIMEDVEQTDKQDIAEGKLKADEVAVQKEDGLLQAIEKAKEVAADMEMWLPNKSDTAKWLLENFDKREMPEIPNLPLPDAFEDIVGKMLDEQKNLDAEDAASNQAIAQMAQGWEIADGPQPGFSAQGKTGNQRPNHNEQMGRSSGGREGMSNGEMAGDTAQKIEGGDTPDVRRTNDPMQRGQVDGGDTEAHARATGGGKAGGYSDRDGMDGNAPLRHSDGKRVQVADPRAVQQKLLADKASKVAAEASLLYLSRSSGLQEVARMMGESEQALKEGRVRDFQNLHQKIVGRLNEVKGGVSTADVRALPSADSARASDKQLLGGSEGDAPPQYKDQVADYYRSLAEGK
jgi:hypothetical protein